MLTMKKTLLFVALFASSITYGMNRSSMDRSNWALCKAVLNEDVEAVINQSHEQRIVETKTQIPYVTGYTKQDVDGSVSHIAEKQPQASVIVYGKASIPTTPTPVEMVHLIRAATTDNQRLLCAYLCLCAAGEDENYYDAMTIVHHSLPKQTLTWMHYLNPLRHDPVEQIIIEGKGHVDLKKGAFSNKLIVSQVEDLEAFEKVILVDRLRMEAELKAKVLKSKKELSSAEQSHKDDAQRAILQKIENDIYGKPQQPEVPTTTWGHVVAFGKDNRYAIAAVGATMGCAAYLYNFFGFRRAQHLMEDEESWMNWTSLTSAQFALVPKDQLGKLLVYSVFQKYDPAGNDIERVFDMFIKDVKKEISYLKPFASRASKLKKIYLGPLFGIQAQHVAQAQEKLDKLVFLRDFYLNEIKAQLEAIEPVS